MHVRQIVHGLRVILLLARHPVVLYRLLIVYVCPQTVVVVVAQLDTSDSRT